MTSSYNSSPSSSNFFPAICFFRWRNKWKSLGANSALYFVREFPLDVHILRWKIIWRNAPRFWRDFGSTMPFQRRLTQTKPVLPLSNEQGTQVKDQVRRQFCHDKYKKFPYRPTRPVIYSLLRSVSLYLPYLQRICQNILIPCSFQNKKCHAFSHSSHARWILFFISFTFKYVWTDHSLT